MSVPTLSEIIRLVAAHAALPENNRMLDAPPRVEIARTCMQCDRRLPPFVCGWKELADQVRRGEPLPEHIGVRGCDACDEGEED